MSFKFFKLTLGCLKAILMSWLHYCYVFKNISNFWKVQASVRETLKKHELTRPLATKEFEWFAVCAVLLHLFVFNELNYWAIVKKNVYCTWESCNPNCCRHLHCWLYPSSFCLDSFQPFSGKYQSSYSFSHFHKFYPC